MKGWIHVLEFAIIMDLEMKSNNCIVWQPLVLHGQLIGGFECRKLFSLVHTTFYQCIQINGPNKHNFFCLKQSGKPS